MLDVTVQTVWKQFPKRHRETPRFAVIAYGKLGGKELGYASDLDLIFLYDDPDDAASDIYAMFTRRLITWLRRRRARARSSTSTCVCGRMANRACS